MSAESEFTRRARERARARAAEGSNGTAAGAGPSGLQARLEAAVDRGGPAALFRDAGLLRELAELGRQDRAEFAALRAALKAKRVPLRDLDAALRQLREQTTGGPPVPAYAERGDGCLWWEGPGGPARLTNFAARVVEEVLRDDGAAPALSFALEGRLADGAALPCVEVTAEDFARSMEWVITRWGTRCTIYPGQERHARCAIQELSGAPPRRVVCAHTGWREVAGEWAYLHAGGAIGAAGNVPGACVALSAGLVGFRLPDPPEGDALCRALRASLRLLDLGPGRIMVPLLAAAYRAPLGDADFALHLAGPTGCFKSEAAALAQQHYGAGLDARHLPGNWSSTDNATERLLFEAKDALLVIDDYCPQGAGGAAGLQRLGGKADRLLRNQGNRAGRQRLRPDGTPQPTRPPRGIFLSTGEDLLPGESAGARHLALEVAEGDLGPPAREGSNELLTECQRDAAAGLYAAALAGFVCWLAPRRAVLAEWVRAEREKLRDAVRAGGPAAHARTVGIVADLALGLRTLFDFAAEAGALTPEQRAELWEHGWQGLATAAAAQAAHVAEEDPARLFLRLLAEAVAAGRAHLADRRGDCPPDEPLRWGWRPEEYVEDAVLPRYRPAGECVGWIIDYGVYLAPEASYAAVQRFARDLGKSFAVTPRALHRRLHQAGLLVTTDARRARLTVRKSVQGGAERDLLHVAWEGAPEVARPRACANGRAAGTD